MSNESVNCQPTKTVEELQQELTQVIEFTRRTNGENTRLREILVKAKEKIREMEDEAVGATKLLHRMEDRMNEAEEKAERLDRENDQLITRVVMLEKMVESMPQKPKPQPVRRQREEPKPEVVPPIIIEGVPTPVYELITTSIMDSDRSKNYKWCKSHEKGFCVKGRLCPFAHKHPHQL